MSDQIHVRMNLGEYLLECSQSEYGVRFITASDREVYCSYKELYHEACCRLAALQSQGLSPGTEVLFQVERPEDFVPSFWACVLGGFIPVPLAVGSNEDHRRKLLNVWNVLDDPRLLCSKKAYKNLARLAEENHNSTLVEDVRSRTIPLEAIEGWTRRGDVREAKSDDLAFIQFSSGSTGTPKGVMLTHRNIIVNLTDAHLQNEYTTSDRFLSWAPLTHDLGIIGFHLCPIIVGAEHSIMDTQLFVRRPVLWMNKTSEHRASILCSPNFGYKHFLKMFKPEKMHSMDLSCIRILLNGAEPTSRTLAEEFLDTLAPYGMKKECMTPGYGMAESTLYTSITSSDELLKSFVLHRESLGIGDDVVFLDSREDPSGVEFVSVGIPYRSLEVRICDENRKPLQDRKIGLIELRGENVTQGYYNNSEATSVVRSPDGWLNSGDLGFLIDGEIVITGRAKDVIFVNGINFYPHDIEQHAESVSGIDLNKVVACGVTDRESQQERIVIFVRYQKSLEDFLPIIKELQNHLLQTMDLAVDTVVPLRTQIPKTTSGKIQRFLLAERFQQGRFEKVLNELQVLLDAEQSAQAVDAGVSRKDVEALLHELLSDVFGDHRLTSKRPLLEQGVQSSRLVQFHKRVCDRFQKEFPLSIVFDYPTLADLSEYLTSSVSEVVKELPAIRQVDSESDSAAVAIVSMACRFPGGVDAPEQLWGLLLQEGNVVRKGVHERFNVSEAQLPFSSGFLDRIDTFDNQFFDLTPTEVVSMEPQQRLLLEVAWHAFERAGYTSRQLQGSRTAVYVGISQKSSVRQQGEDLSPFAITGSSSSTAVGRISYLFGLEGPNMAIDTACSSSLVAVHHAVQSIRRGEADLVLCGGVNIFESVEEFEALSLMGALSEGGQCHTFGADADGYARGEGCGLIVLKSLDRAKADGDHIHGVIRGSALNHDGRSNGLTAPSGRAQKKLLEEALRDAKIEASSVQYVEAHGTGTPLGDPIEVQSLGEVYATSDRETPLYLGSVKSNIGHLECAAGIAGLMKLVLSLEHGIAPRSLYCSARNQHIAWEALNIALADDDAQVLPTGLRCGGVSSFGFSGTNAHVIIESAPSKPQHDKLERPVAERTYVLPLSAHSPEALQDVVQQFRSFVTSYTGTVLDLCTYAAQCKDHYTYRLAIPCQSIEDIQTAFDYYDSGRHTSAALAVSDSKITLDSENLVAMFSGQGSQYIRMGQYLYDHIPVFRKTFDSCSSFVEKEAGFSLIDLLYGEGASQETIQQTNITQPLLVAFQYSLYSIWKRFGVSPNLVMGHSIGEYTAACVAGLFSIEDALRMAIQRGRLLQTIESKGAMCAVLCSEERLQDLLAPFTGSLCIATMNAPENTVVSGDADVMNSFCEQCRLAGIKTRSLRVSHAFHSHHIDSVLDEFASILEGISFQPLTKPIVSLQDASYGTFDRMSTPEYWVSHLREAVRFKQGVTFAFNEGYTQFLEIGPGTTLSAFVTACAEERQIQTVPTLKKGDAEDRRLAMAVSNLYAMGQTIAWEHVYVPIPRSSMTLPAYPFQESSFEYPGLLSSTHTSVDKIVDRQPQGNNHPYGKEATKAVDRMPELIQGLLTIVSDVTAREESALDIHQNLFKMGLDSLLIVQIRQVIQRRYDVSLEMNRFFSELESIHKIASYLDSVLERPEPIAHEESSVESLSSTESLKTNGLQEIFSEQLNAMNALMSQQLDVIRATVGGEQTSVPKNVTNGSVQARSVSPTRAPLAQKDAHGPYKVLRTERTKTFSEQQRSHVEKFSERYLNLTGSSREHTERYRSVYANSRNVIGFNPELKEFIYPLSVSRAEGAHIWDLDGREYVDITMGFGVTLLGHNPPFIEQALQREISRGAAVGPMTVYAGEVAERICRMGKVERAAFFTTGTEAIMAGIRIARMCSGRDKIVIFQDAYHGSFDGVLAGGGLDGTQPYSFPVAPGTPQSLVDDVIVLPYGVDSSLEIIDRIGHEIGAVLVEPVASRKPALQPASFLKELRRITLSHDTLLLFDEIILGFRLLQGGAQEWFGVEADLVTYGKVVGGGLPIGVLAGKQKYLDAVDGGYWQYGDESVPGKKTAFVAGTFNNHPLTMAAAHAAMLYLEEQGPELQKRLNARTEAFVARLTRYFQQEQVPIEVPYFGSLFRFEYPADLELFNYHLIEAGVYVWEGKNCFLSTAHTDDDIDAIVEAVKKSVDQLRKGGFLTKENSSVSNEVSFERPLSQSQKELLFLTQASFDANRAYQEVIHLEMKGDIDSDILSKAMRTLCSRHEMLQTIRFTGSSRTIDPDCVIDCEVVDFTERPDYVGDSLLKEWMIHECLRPFDLQEGPFIRPVLIRRDNKVNHLFIVVHHLIADGWSLGLLLEELAELYRAISMGQEISLRQPATYDSFLDWEKQCAEQLTDDQCAYWQNVAAGAESLQLPVSSLQASEKSYDGMRLRRVLSPGRVESLKEFSQEEGVSTVMTLLSLYRIWLSQLSQQQSFVVGVPLAAHADMPSSCLVGQCTRMLPFVSGDNFQSSFKGYVASIKKDLVEALSNQYAIHSVPQMPSIHALFNMDKSFQLDFGKIEVRFAESPISFVKFDLFMNVLEVNDAYVVDLDFNSNKFSESLVSYWWSRFEELLDSLLQAPQESLVSQLQHQDFSFVSESELNRTTNKKQVLLSDFLQQIEQQPESVALVHGQEQCTYRDLSRRVQDVVSRLYDLNVRPGDSIAVVCDSPIRYLETFLASLYAGTTLVPLSYSRTREEIGAALDAHSISCVVCHNGLEYLLPDLERFSILSLDRLIEEVGVRKILPVHQWQDNECVFSQYYVNDDTSIGRLPLTVETFTAQRLEFQGLFTDGGKRSLLFTSAACSVSQIALFLFSNVATGGTIHVHSAHETVEDAQEGVRLLNQELADRVIMPIGFYRAMKRVCKESSISLPMQLLLTTTFEQSLDVDLQAAQTDVKVCAHPRAVPVGHYLCSVDELKMLGNPCDRTHAAVLATNGTEAWHGVYGELVFFSEVQGKWHCYPTGLRARSCPKGLLHSTGLMQRAVSYKGQVVQLEMIESALMRHPNVLTAAVDVYAHDKTEPSVLSACIIESGRYHMTAKDLQGYLQRQVSYALIPQQYAFLSALPKTPLGMVDMGLLHPNEISFVAGSVQEPPEGDLEEFLAAAWQEVLHVMNVGRHDDFFLLGGQSIHAAQILARVQEHVQTSCQLIDLFQYPSPASFAAFLEGSAIARSPIQGVSDAEHYPVSHAQARLWLLEQLEPGLLAYSMPVVLEVADVIDVDPMREAFYRVLERHESLRTVFASQDGVPVQRILPVCKEAYAFISCDQEQVHEEIRKEIQTPFQLDRGPLCTLTLYAVENAEKMYIVLNIHHIISDGWSMKVFIDDLLTEYEAGRYGEPSLRPALSIQYRDYAVWEGRQHQEVDLCKARDYWVDQLTPLPEPLDIVGDFPRPEEKTYSGAAHQFRLGQERFSLLQQFSEGKGGSRFMTLIALFKALLYRETGQEDIAIGTTLAGRDRKELQDQIGFYVNNLVLRDMLSADQSFVTLYEQVRNTIIEAYQHQHYPYDSLVHDLGVVRDPSRNPLFDIMVVMDDRKDLYARLEEYGLREYIIEPAYCQFDLTCYFTEEDSDLSVVLNYNTDIYSAKTIERICDHFCWVIDSCLRDPEQALGDVLLDYEQSQSRLSTLHQERLWFVDAFEKHQLYDGSPVYYTMPLITSMPEGVRYTALSQAIQDLVERHEILRSTFSLHDGAVVSSVGPSYVPTLEIKRYSGSLTSNSSCTSMRQLALQEVKQSFDVEQDHLLRAVLYVGDDESACLFLLIHHILVDDHSLLALGRELEQRYQTYQSVSFEEVDLADTSLSDYVQWEQSVIQDPGINADCCFWKHTLDGDLVALELPLDRPRPAIHTYTGGVQSLQLPDQLMSSLSTIASGSEVSREALFFAMFQVLLARYSRQETIVCGTPFRSHTGTNDDVVGPLSNLLVIASTIDLQIPCIEFVKEFSSRLDSAKQHGAFPFDSLVREINPDNDMSRTALFDVLFRFKEHREGVVSAWQFYDSNLGWGKYDLVCLIDEEMRECTFTFNTDLFDPQSIEQMLVHYQRLLKDFAEKPEVSLCDLHLLTKEEQNKLSYSQASQALFPKEASLVSLLKKQVDSNPHARAIRCDGEEICYQDLWLQSNKVAHSLRTNGITCNVPVAVLMERSIEQLVAFIGIMKAGAAYVPIDPAYPEERILYVLNDSQVESLIVDTDTSPVPTLWEGTRLLFDDLCMGADTNLTDVSIQSQDMAYVIYTSGSTGKPKGVQIEHGNVVSLLCHEQSPFDFGAQDVWTMFHSPCFDFSVWEMYGALLFGGTLLIVPKEIAQQPGKFAKLVIEEQVSILNQTPSYFYELQNELRSYKKLGDLRMVIFGGEALLPARLSEFHDRAPQISLINMFGITETTVHVTYKKIDREAIKSGESNIGKPLPTLDLYVLDDNNHPVPPGVIGELCVGGYGVSRGYLHKPELTAERFPEHPFDSSQRFYRSGDLGRMSRSGEILYVGRRDTQVKIRGFRIETGEIEHFMLQHPQIRDVVVVDKVVQDETLLQAVIVLSEGNTIDVLQLRAWLGEKLPDYMIPTTFIYVEQMPLTGNGKVDRQTLRSLEARTSATTGEEDDSSPLEQKLCRIFAEVLGRSKVGVADNFFVLGGHSLKATQVTSRIQDRLGVLVTLKDFFRFPVVQELVENLSFERSHMQESVTVVEEASDYLSSFAQRRLWIYEQLNQGSLAYSCCASYLLDGSISVSALRKAFEYLQNRHESLRTVFLQRDGEVRQCVKDKPQTSLVVHDFSKEGSTTEQEIEIRDHIRAMVQIPFNLEEGPLVRADLYVMRGDDECASRAVLAFNMHHIVSDGWSVSVFARDLISAYEQVQEQNFISQPSLGIQYKDYAAWQHEFVHSSEGKQARDYWRKQFQDFQNTVTLPADFDRQEVSRRDGGSLSFEFSALTKSAFKDIQETEGVSQFMIFYSMMALLIHRYTDEIDVTIGSPIAGRDMIAFEDQIGFFLNTLPLRSRVTKDSSYVHFLHQVKEMILDAYNYQRYPFDLLVEDLSLERKVGEHPLFNVMIILQNNDDVDLSCSEFRASLYLEENMSSKFDLNFMFHEDCTGVLEYDTDRYKRETVERYISDLLQLGDLLAKGHDQSVESLCSAVQTGDQEMSDEEFLQQCLEVSDQF